jgi:gliding motility-associated-like protein
MPKFTFFLSFMKIPVRFYSICLIFARMGTRLFRFNVQGFILLLFIGNVFFRWNLLAQPLYNECTNALELCSGQSFNVNNIGANKTFCPGCEDDFSFCFSPSNSIWLTFTTNATGGAVNVTFSNLVFDNNPSQGNSLQATLLLATVPCNSASYTAIGNCEAGANGPFSLNGIGLLPNTLYYVVISGSMTGAGVTLPATCTFDVSISGTAVDRPLPLLTANPNTNSICKGDAIYVEANLLNCPDAGLFSWYINDTLVAQTSDTLFSTADLSDGDVLSVQTSCFMLCPLTVASGSFIVSVYDFPLDAGPDFTIIEGGSVQLTGSTSALIYSWTPTFNVSDTLSLTPFVNPAITTTYTLTASQNDCTKQDQVTVQVLQELLIPTTFSPNDDGANDKWVIEGAELYPNCYVEVFSRWGQKVFQATGYSKAKAWDGSTNSGQAPEGVYYYVVQLRDEEKRQFQGSVHLIR